MSASIDKTAYQVQASCEYDKLDQFNEKLSQIKNIDKIYMINKDVYGFQKVNGFKQDIYNVVIFTNFIKCIIINNVHTNCYIITVFIFVFWCNMIIDILLKAVDFLETIYIFTT